MATRSAQPLTKPGPVRLFISYARVERDSVEWLARALEKAGYSVWWDAALEGGHHFAAEISRELDAADAVLVVWSEDALLSHWVLDEASAGRDRGCLIPVRFDETEPPLGFRQIQVIDLEIGAETEAVNAVGRAAGRLMGKTVPAEVPGTGRRLKSKGKRQYPLWWPFAWAFFGLIVWILVSGRYG